MVLCPQTTCRRTCGTTSSPTATSTLPSCFADLRCLLGFDFTSENPEQKKLRDHLERIRDETTAAAAPEVPGKASPAGAKPSGRPRACARAEVLARTERTSALTRPPTSKVPYESKARLIKPDPPQWGQGLTAPRPAANRRPTPTPIWTKNDSFPTNHESAFVLP